MPIRATPLALRFAALCAAVGACATAHADTNLALGQPTLASSFYDEGSEVFPAANIVDGVTIDTGSPGNWSFWLSTQGTTAGQWVQVDLGVASTISHVTLFDTHNRGYYDRGTQGFELQTSSNGSVFTTVATDAFTSAQWQNQTALDESFASPVTARYVRFLVDSCYGCSSAGLAEMQVFGQAVPEPSRWLLTAAGFAIVGAGRRRLGIRRSAET